MFLAVDSVLYSTGKVLELLGSCSHVTSVYNVNVMWCLRELNLVGRKKSHIKKGFFKHVKNADFQRHVCH
jgi:hypothetical protein